MDQSTMVVELLDDGWKVINTLQEFGLRVDAAAWLKFVEDQRWALYLVSKDVEDRGLIAGYKLLAGALHSIGKPSLAVSDIKLIGVNHRFARILLSASSTLTARYPTKLNLIGIDGMPLEEIYAYPRSQNRATGESPSVLRFQFRSKDDFQEVMERFIPRGRHVINSELWRGKEPHSCRIGGVSTNSAPLDSAEPLLYKIDVTYRPKKSVSYVGNTRYEGWTAVILKQERDGTLLNEAGKPLAINEEPVYLRQEVYEAIDFNEIDFGEFIGETEFEDVGHVEYEQVMVQFHNSRHHRGSLKSRFVAPKRQRPTVKIMLTHQEGEFITGFGHQLINVTVPRPGLKQEIVNIVDNVMNDFIEGKVSIKNFDNGNFVLVELDDLLVDCTPENQDDPNRFKVLRKYIPSDYMESLAVRLAANYEVEVKVVDGPVLGLLLSRSEPSKDL